MTLPSFDSLEHVLPAPRSPSWERPRICPNSWARINALDKPSSLFNEQDLSGSQTPETGA